MSPDPPSKPRPPRVVRGLLGRLLPRRDRAHILVEMDTLYAHRARRVGAVRASLWYTWRLAAFPVRIVWSVAGAGALSASSALSGVLRDVRLGARTLRRRRGYALANVVTLSVGVGGLATVYAVANWVLLRPVPAVADPTTLVTLRLELQEAPGTSPAFPISEPDRVTLAERSGSLKALAASHDVDVNAILGSGIPPRHVSAAVVSRGYFGVLGVRPVEGRLADGSRTEADAAVVVVSRDLWRDVWADSPDAVGATVRVDGRPFTVVGVAPAGFHGAELPGEARMWFPVDALPLVDPGYGPSALEDRGARLWTGLVGRLAPGGSPAAAAREANRAIAVVRSRYRVHSYPALFEYRAYAGVGLSPRVRGPVGRTLTLLAGAAALLLLLAMANVTNLSLIHATARRGEAAVHAALGAGRARIGRRILAEQALLGIAGGGGGVLVSAGVIHAFRDVSLSDLGASLSGLHLDARVVTTTLLGALAITLLAGLVPAVNAGAGDLRAALSRHRGGSRRTQRIQAGLVVTQMALSTLLLVGAGLFLRTVINVRRADVGFSPDHVLRFSVDPGLEGPGSPDIRDVVARIEEKIVRTPGVVTVGFASPRPVRNSYTTFAVEPHVGTPRQRHVVGAQLQVTPGFLSAMGAHFLAGATLTTAVATDGAPLDVVISRRAAQAVWPALSPADAVGRTLYRVSGRTETPMRVRGVIEDPRILGATREPPPLFVLPWGSGPAATDVAGWVRVHGRPRDVTPLVRAAVGAAAPSLPVYEAKPVRAAMDDLIVEDRVIMRLALGLALVGLVLAGVGLHGVLGYLVTQRRREIGVRIALGARPLDLVGRLMRRGLVLTASGALVGGGAALALTRFIASRLFGVAPLDPLTWGAGMTLLLTTAALATWSPANRSLRIPPRDALNAE